MSICPILLSFFYESDVFKMKVNQLEKEVNKTLVSANIIQTYTTSKKSRREEPNDWIY